jgi:oligoribonuclease NrnB/cAMP/cGMP phosphodiesterase (DHH superfamily)
LRSDFLLAYHQNPKSSKRRSNENREREKVLKEREREKVLKKEERKEKLQESLQKMGSQYFERRKISQLQNLFM